ncbi:MAG: type II 3-dehydroquinate dehydratase [Alphaproteobacteria bacterium]
MPDLVFILNGPNLNLLGTREPDVYGHSTLADIEENCQKKAESLGFAIDFRQSNKEGELVDWIQAAAGPASGIIINPGAYSHTSVAIHDALLAVGIPAIEVHLSNIFAREPFRRHSYVSPVAAGVISGLGPHVYTLALDAISHLVRS